MEKTIFQEFTVPCVSRTHFQEYYSRCIARATELGRWTNYLGSKVRNFRRLWFVNIDPLPNEPIFAVLDYYPQRKNIHVWYVALPKER